MKRRKTGEHLYIRDILLSVSLHLCHPLSFARTLPFKNFSAKARRTKKADVKKAAAAPKKKKKVAADQDASFSESEVQASSMEDNSVDSSPPQPSAKSKRASRGARKAVSYQEESDSEE